MGLVTRAYISSPVVKNGRVVGFYTGWPGGRKFPIDMAGFAIAVKYYRKVCTYNSQKRLC